MSLVTDTETEARSKGLPCPAEGGWGQPRPQLAHHLLTCFLWGQVVGTGHISASQPPRQLPPGRPGQRAQVSRTAGPSASSHPHLHGARGSVTPQGPTARQAGWPSGGGQARPALMLPPMSLGRLGCPGVFTGTLPTASSHDPGAHPLGYGLGLPCWGPSVVHRLRRAGWAAGRSWPHKCSEKCLSEGPSLLSYLVLLGREGSGSGQHFAATNGRLSATEPHSL